MLTPTSLRGKNGRYDGFEHLRRALFWEDHDLMFAHTAYFDDSGKKETEVLLVGGYVATVTNWDRFNGEWRPLIAKKGLAEFKRSEFNARQIGDWSNTERDHFLADLAQIIHRYTLHAFAYTVSMPDWKRANEKYQMAEKHFYPYPLCARTCMKGVRDWCDRERHDKNQVEYIFDKGSEHAEHLPLLLKRDSDPNLQKIALIPADSEKVAPIQAADYFAWEIRHQFLKNPDPHPSEAYRTLFRLLRVPNAQASIGNYDYDRLEELCIKAQVPLRPAQ
jgi:hypothetical protein